MRRILGRLALVVLVVLGYCGWRIGWGHPFTINQLANRQALLYFMRDPELFTQIGLADGTLLDFHSGKLAEVSVAARDEANAMLGRFLEEVKEFDREALDTQERITYDVLLDFFGTAYAYREFPWLSMNAIYPISPMYGTQVRLASFMQNSHTVSNEKTARNYVKRLVAMEHKLDQVTAEMQRQSAAGVVLPPALLQHSLDTVDSTIAGEPADNALVTSFAERMAKTEGKVDAELQKQLLAEASAAVRDHVYPAYARMREALVVEQPKTVGVTAGVGRLPDGAAFYRAMLREYTTTDYTAEHIHELGLSEIERITAEADTLLRSQGITEGTVGERIGALTRDPRFLLSNDDAGREQILQRFRDILHEVNTRMPEFFAHPPTGELEVKRMPLAAEKGSSGAYYSPGALDGSRSGTFFASLRDLSAKPTWGLKTLAYHEGIPGHHFQIAAAMELKDLPLLRQQTLYSAFAEGWALYAERLASEIGMYQGDPFGDLGRLQAEMFRAARLVVDTGLHSRDWNREQAIDYMVGVTGRAPAEVTSEVERYMALPGQACAYKVGQLKILELRERAKQKLGDSFDLKRFHDIVLGNGSVPLTLLEQLVDEWIAGGGV